jgi:hypothetical protein
MVNSQVKANMRVNVRVVEVNLHAFRELGDGIERTLAHDRLINLGLADILVCHDSELTVVEVYRALGVNTQNPREWY